MRLSEVRDILKQFENRLMAMDVEDPVVQQAVEELLNLIEQLVANQQNLPLEVQGV